MKDRPVLVAVIGYIIGILMGLYFNFSIIPFYILLTAIYTIIRITTNSNTKRRFKLISFHRYIRYIKIIVNKKVILIILVSSIISNSIIIIQNRKYNNLYQNHKLLYLTGIIVSNKLEKQYKDVYKVKVETCNQSKKYNNTYVYLNINKKTKADLKYGDKVILQGEFVEPTSQRNKGGFDYKQYLKTKKIYGSINVENIQVKAHNQTNILLKITNDVSLKLKENINNILEKEEASILKGLILGDTSNIEHEIYEKFQISNMAHILAVSGMHISYIILGMQILLNQKMGKRKTKIYIIIILILYMMITGFSPSIVRASIMGILTMSSGIVYRRNDIWNSIAISLLCILIYNPFLIMHIGLQLSYLGTIGIIIFQKNILDILEKIKSNKKKYNYSKRNNLVVTKIKEILSVTFSAQIAILPILLYHFNFTGIYFWITNLIISIIIGPIILLGFISIILSFISNIFIIEYINNILAIAIKVLIQITNFSQLPFAKIYIPTPNICIIVLYYILVIAIKFIYSIYHKKKVSITEKRIRNLLAVIKYKWRQKRKKEYIKVLIIIILILFTFQFIPKNLKIHFVDVGQGDCTFIVTPKNKTILIDGGGIKSNEFDIGKRILLPYILARGYRKIDYVIISHVDQDHIRTEC